MILSPKFNYRKNCVSCFDIEEVPRSPGKWNWNLLSFLPFIFTFEQSVASGLNTNRSGLSENECP